MSAAAIDFNTVDVAGNADLSTTQGDISGASLKAGRLTVQANNDVRLTQVDVAGTAGITTGGALAIASLTAQGNTGLDVGTSATITTLTVGDAATQSDLTVSSQGILNLLLPWYEKKCRPFSRERHVFAPKR